MLRLNNRGIHVSITVVMLFQVCALFIREFVRAKLGDEGISSAEAKDLSALVGFAVLAVLMWPIFREVGPALRPLAARPNSWPRLIISAVAVGALTWLTITLVLLFTSTFDWITSTERTNAARPIYEFGCGDVSLLFLTLPVMCVLTPVVEEVINRGMFLYTLIPKGRLLAIVVSAFLFMILHRPESYLTAFFFGIIAAVQMLHWQNLWGLVITHGTVNVLVGVHELCVNSRWLIGRIDLGFGGFAQFAALATIVSFLLLIWLVTRTDIATGSPLSRS